jgi:peptidoglycan/LPS O-acetylase OafA/YrhL
VNSAPVAGVWSRVAKRLGLAEDTKTETLADPASGRMLALDGWRGISALMVVVAHLISERYSLGNFSTSTTGVLIFYVISGFIITKLAIGERAKYGHFSIGRFCTRRALRILPPFFVYLAFVYFASLTGLIQQDPTQVYKAGAFMCTSGFIMLCDWFVAHSSSLGYEEMFYLLFPLIFFAFGQRPRVAFGAILAGLLTFLLLRRTLQLQVSFVTLTAALFIFICSGALAAAFEPVIARLARSPLGTVLWLVSAAIVIAKIVYSSIFQTPIGPLNLDVETSLPFLLKLLPAATTWLVVGSLYGRSRIFAFLTWRPILWIGQISYSLYLWQQLFTASPQLYLVSSPLLIPPLLLAAAAASYYWIELPCRRITKWLMTQLESDSASIAATKSMHVPP